MTIGGEGKKGYITPNIVKEKISTANKKNGKERYKKKKYNIK